MTHMYIKAQTSIRLALQEQLTRLSQEAYAYDIRELDQKGQTIQGHAFVFYQIENEEDKEKVEMLCKETLNIRFILLVQHESFICSASNIIGYIQCHELIKGFEMIKENIIRECTMWNSYFHYESGFMNFDINPQNVVYVESYHHEVYIHTKNMMLKLRDNLKNYRLDTPYFQLIQVHKSFIVNVACIKQIENNTIVMCTDICIPIGETYRMELNKKISAFINSD